MVHLFLAGASFGFHYQMGPGGSLISILGYVITVAGLWAMFEKAGESGWQAIIPIWNYIVLFRIAGRPWWWVVIGLFSFLIIPGIVFIVLYIIAMRDVARSFGRGLGTTIGLIVLNGIFFCILGFGSAQYLGPAAKGALRPAGSLT